MTNDPLCPLLTGQTAYPDGPNKNRYTPEVLNGTLQSMPTNDIEVVQRKTVLLQYPYDTKTTTLELRNPELNDLQLFQAYRVHTYSRGDTLHVYRDPNWFRTSVVNWSFTALTNVNRNDILAFINMSAGKYITVTDYWSRVFKCVIVNPNNAITQELPDYKEVPFGTAPVVIKGAGYTWKVDLQKELT